MRITNSTEGEARSPTIAAHTRPHLIGDEREVSGGTTVQSHPRPIPSLGSEVNRGLLK